MDRQKAWELLCKYNEEPFHRLHARTVEAVMGWFAEQLGYSEDADFWRMVGLLHDIDFEMYPELHCKRCCEILSENGYDERLIHAVASHGYGACSEVEPQHVMERVLFACDELTGLIGAAALMRPSKSVQDMELSSLKKKFKDKKFAAGVSRDIIIKGAEQLSWELDKLLEMTLTAMKDVERVIAS